jgi:hypothetical protein
MYRLIVERQEWYSRKPKKRLEYREISMAVGAGADAMMLI